VVILNRFECRLEITSSNKCTSLYRSGSGGRCCIGTRQTLRAHSPGSSSFLREVTYVMAVMIQLQISYSAECAKKILKVGRQYSLDKVI